MTIEKSHILKDALKTGLSGKAGAVYVALLEAGLPLSPKALILRTRLHRQYLYDALHELEERRLVVSTGEGKRIRYQAASPDRLLQDAEKQRLDAFEGVRNLMKLYDRSPAGVVEIIRGSEAALEDEFIRIREAKEGDFIDIIGGGGMNWVHLMGDHVKKWEAIQREKKIKLRYIGAGDEVRYNREVSIVENESRIIPGIGDAITITIRPTMVTFDIYQPEIVYVRVKDPAVVASQRALFEVLWNIAK
jgi:hypothetical protein